jgi:hypothetical protein
VDVIGKNNIIMENIAFVDFWDGFIQNNNFIYHLLKDIDDNIEVVSPNDADTIIFSCFGNSHMRYSNKKKIFFTGENKRPDYNVCDFSISFDFDSYNGRNIRIPLWYYYIDWFNKGSYNNPDYLIPLDYLNNSDKNIFSSKNKTKFCSAVFSNPVGTRMNMVNLLNSYKNVDCYGKPHSLKIQDGEQYKMDIISDYKFSICFENSITEGYYTEKLLHAKIAGNIPIYYSDKKMSEDFNPKSCLNLYNYNNMNELFEHIKDIDNDERLYKEIYNEPLFNKLSIDNIKKEIVKII